MTPVWNREKRTGSRGRIVSLLAAGRRTVEDLAGTLGITKNAVRAQLALLEREGLVEAQGEVKGSRRPAVLYGVREGADVHFSKAYPLVLSRLVRALSERMQPSQIETVMRDVGRGIAETAPRQEGTARERVDGAVKFLSSLGSLAEVSEERGRLVIKGHGCPISMAVDADVRSCKAMETLIAHLTGLPVTERCVHGTRPSCRFEIKMLAGKG